MHRNGTSQGGTDTKLVGVQLSLLYGFPYIIEVLTYDGCIGTTDKAARQLAKFTDSEEEQRLIVLEERIARQKRILADSIAERRKIMMRAIRRMRRSKGKT